MMQFTETAHSSNTLALCLDLDNAKFMNHHYINNHRMLNNSNGGEEDSNSSQKSAISFIKSSWLKSSGNCMEQLLVHCANAIESNDSTLAQQILWVLNNIAPADGDCNQRLTSAFLRALVTRASKTGSCNLVEDDADVVNQHFHRFSAVELASFIDLTPWYRFGYCAANSAIVEAVEGCSAVHILDISNTHCMQMPTLIELLANRPEGPPLLRLTVTEITSLLAPPILDLSYEELGARLVNFARSRNVSMEFNVVQSEPSDAFASIIENIRVQQILNQGEFLVINCQMMLHYIPDETAGSAFSCISLRSLFLKALVSLQPNLVIVVDEDADFTAGDVVGRLKSAFNYLWMPYDSVDTFLPKGSQQRRWYEAGIQWKIENVIAYEGVQRVERLEPKARWAHRMRYAGFRGLGFSDETVGEVKGMLDEHAAGWGLKKEEQDIVLTWKGHNVVFATIWMPNVGSNS